MELPCSSGCLQFLSLHDEAPTTTCSKVTIRSLWRRSPPCTNHNTPYDDGTRSSRCFEGISHCMLSCHEPKLPQGRVAKFPCPSRSWQGELGGKLQELFGTAT